MNVYALKQLWDDDEPNLEEAADAVDLMSGNFTSWENRGRTYPEYLDALQQATQDQVYQAIKKATKNL